MAQNLDPDVVALRRAEVERCTHISQIFQCEERWKREDAAAERTTQKAETTRLAQLEAQVRRLKTQVQGLESMLGINSKDGGPLVVATGRTIGQLREELEELKRYPAVHDCGVWRDDHGYDAGSLVSHGGGGWIAQRDTTASERPGTSPGWRLAVKSDLAEVRKVVKAELANR